LIEDSPRIPELMGGVVLNEGDNGVLHGLSKETAVILTAAGAGQQVAAQAPLVIDPNAPTALTVTAPVDPRTLRNEIEADLQSMLIAFAAFALLAALAGLTNAMIVAVIERRQEFGMRLAIGARRFHITGLVFAESVLIGLFGGVGGLVAGVVAILAVTISQQWQPVFDPVLAPVAVIGGVTVGALGGLLAAARAARILPGEALRL
jgi:macrolide transport system ATP-binding/permease protein